MLPFLSLLGSKIPSFFITNWKLIVFGSLIVIVVYQNQFTFEWFRMIGLRTIPGITIEYERKLLVKQQMIDALSLQIEACEEGRTLLKQEIEKSNQHINQLADKSEQLEEQYNQVLVDISAIKEQNEQEIQNILKQTAPKTCTGAIKLLRDTATDGEISW